MNMERVYGVIQSYQSDSGESIVHVDGYITEELAKKGLFEVIEGIKEEIVDNGYEVDEEVNDDETDVFIRDTGDNRYSIKLEEIRIHIK